MTGSFSTSASRPQHGFSLVELMVSMTISVIVLAGVVSAFLFLGRTGMGIEQYSDIQNQGQSTLQYFGQDCRQATDAVWTDDDTLTLTVDGSPVTYVFSQADGTLRRNNGASSWVMLDGVSVFDFEAFDIDANALNIASSPSLASNATKMIQIEVTLSRSAKTTAGATGQVISARFVLRNKKVS